jgi:hypothetical protein
VPSHNAKQKERNVLHRYGLARPDQIEHRDLWRSIEMRNIDALPKQRSHVFLDGWVDGGCLMKCLPTRD